MVTVRRPRLRSSPALRVGRSGAGRAARRARSSSSALTSPRCGAPRLPRAARRSASASASAGVGSGRCWAGRSRRAGLGRRVSVSGLRASTALNASSSAFLRSSSSRWARRRSSSAIRRFSSSSKRARFFRLPRGGGAKGAFAGLGFRGCQAGLRARRRWPRRLGRPSGRLGALRLARRRGTALRAAALSRWRSDAPRALFDDDCPRRARHARTPAGAGCSLERQGLLAPARGVAALIVRITHLGQSSFYRSGSAGCPTMPPQSSGRVSPPPKCGPLVVENASIPRHSAQAFAPAPMPKPLPPPE